MHQIVINGGKPLCGRVSVSGFKNAALPILFATVLIDDECTISNIPEISDVIMTLDILRAMGVKVTQLDETTYRFDSREATYGRAPCDLVHCMRASLYVLGAELGRFGKTALAAPGGCNFGERPIDLHMKAFRALGATMDDTPERITGHADTLVGASIYLDIVSVGATINAMLASVMAEGQTVIENAAHEPHIIDLANFLNACGASIKGAGTDVIKINGVSKLHGCVHEVIPDMIEAGTFMVAAAVTGGSLIIDNVIPKHLEAVASVMREVGVKITEGDESVTVEGGTPLTGFHLSTRPYPGFPTDMHPQMSVLLCLADGVSTVTETIFEKRFRYTEELRQMGASIRVDDNVATIQGGNRLLPAAVKAVDLRAGAAMILAGLAARGKTTISNIELIERGYHDIVGKMRSVGADIYME